MTKRVMLTGAAGFLGSHALRHILTNTDWEVIAPVTFRHKGIPQRIVVQMEGRQDWYDRLRLVRGDLTAPIDPIATALIGDVDYVINYASESHVDRSIEQPVPFIRNNVDVMMNVLEYARIVRPTAVIQISTDEVYGPAPAGHAHREWEAVIPSNPYSASKAAQEAIVTAWWRTYDIPVAIVNSMNLVGELQDPEKFVPLIMSRLQDGQTVPIHGEIGPDGQVRIGSRYYMHARNLADAILFLLRRGRIARYAEGFDRPDRWHVVGEREVDNLSLLRQVAELMGITDPAYEVVTFHASRPGHDLRYALDGAKIAAEGWRAPLSLDDSLARVVDWTLKHPDWWVADNAFHP